MPNFQLLKLLKCGGHIDDVRNLQNMQRRPTWNFVPQFQHFRTEFGVEQSELLSRLLVTFFRLLVGESLMTD